MRSTQASLWTWLMTWQQWHQIGRKDYGPQTRKERWPTSLGYIFSPPDNSHKDREKPKPESNDNLQKTNYNWTITYWLQAPCKTREHAKVTSGPCGHCALCGNHGKHNKSMLPCVSQTMSRNKTFPLNQKLTCANHGIYVATCVICHEQYWICRANQKQFSMRWSSHHSNWNRPNCEFDENNNDKVALLRHFAESNGDVSKPQINEAYPLLLLKNPIPLL